MYWIKIYVIDYIRKLLYYPKKHGTSSHKRFYINNVLLL